MLPINAFRLTSDPVYVQVVYLLRPDGTAAALITEDDAADYCDAHPGWRWCYAY